MNPTVRRAALLCFGAVLALVFCAGAHADTACPMSPTGALVCSLSVGSNYFQTQTGTFFTFPAPIGVVDFMGVPVGPGSTDTIVQRLNEPTLIPGGPAATVNTMLTTLSLESTTPITLGPDSYNVLVTLDPANLAKDTGTLLVSLNAAATGGTFDSTLNVYFEVAFNQMAGPPSPIPDQFLNITLTSSSNPWSTTPAAGALLISGPDDGGSSDQAADIHTALDAGELDFFPAATLSEGGPGEGHVVSNTPTPEPGSFLLLFAAIPALGVLRRSMLSRASR